MIHMYDLKTINEELNENYSTIYYDKSARNNAQMSIKTKNKFLIKLLEGFFLSYKSFMDIDKTSLKIFFKVFVDSLTDVIPNCILDFSQQLFYNQYKFLINLDLKLRNSGRLKDAAHLQYFLLAFYRYLEGNYTDSIKKVFDDVLIQAIKSRNFYKYFDEGFIFVYYNPYERPPEGDKFCILPDIKNLHGANLRNLSWKGINIENVNIKYKADLKNFIWNIGLNTSSSINHLAQLIQFLNSKEEFNSEENKIKYLNKNSNKEFDEIFLWDYKSNLEVKISNKGNLKSILKIIRKYLKYYDKKYNVKSSDFDILSLKGIENDYKGGTPITDNDCELIYNEFVRHERIDIKNRIYTIVFELFISSHYRIGEILNFKRDSLDGNVLTYYSKTGKEQRKEQEVTQKVSSLIKEAIEITNKYVNENDLISEFIFINTYISVHKNYTKRIEFRKYFYNMLNEISSKLDYTDYVPYNIRHTYIDNAYKEGVKNDLSIQKIAKITDISYKTANKHYRRFNDIENYVETMAKVTISDVDINGEIVFNEKSYEYNPVKDELGGCKKDSCNFEIGECLRCKSFITFTNRIPAFEKMIKSINISIECTNNKVLIQELNIEKKLLAKYLSEMYKMIGGGD